MKCFYSSSLIAQQLTHKEKKVTIFAKSHTERHRVTLASSICFLRAVMWVVCICMHRCDRCWQLLMSDCKVLIMTAADSYLNLDASKTLLEGQNQTQDYIISHRMKKKVCDYSICLLINAVIITLRNVDAKQCICGKNIKKKIKWLYICIHTAQVKYETVFFNNRDMSLTIICHFLELARCSTYCRLAMTSGMLLAMFSFSPEASRHSSHFLARSLILSTVFSCLFKVATCKSCEQTAALGENEKNDKINSCD